MASGPDPIKVIQDHLPEHIGDLETELEKAVARVWELQRALTKAKVLLAVAPPETKEKP